ncbi:hypothetical protein PENTCL1PPCAC_23174 [Pristionchus entomophagus]|uniref:RING-type E3 ubiquitin transferase n=1 Tax=Pristionchus entomophagus TaxID=358040 RepID=A0AAV5U3K5_9BILA|nr:hypothetical protein PENTCL1PPCAC_23174 [Pristionchus entomophagus]
MSSSERNDEAQPTNGGEGRSEQPETAAPAADNGHPAEAAAGQQHPQQPPLHQGPQDLFGMLANIIPQAMEGIVNSILNGGGGARPTGEAASGAAENEQPLPVGAPAMGGMDRLVDMMRQQQQIWENMEGRIDGLPEERRRREEEDPVASIFAQLGGVMENLERQHHQQPDASSRPAAAAATAAPINLMQHVVSAAAGLAGTGPSGGNGQSFMERLQAATAAGAAHAAQPGTSNEQQMQPPRPPPQANGEGGGGGEAQRHVFQLPQFGGARIEIIGMPGNLNDIFRQMRGGFDPMASSGSRIPDEDLARLPNSKVRQSHIDDEKQCFICMDQYTQVGEPAAEMTCGHIFHTACIVPWLKRNRTCPVCRAEVISTNWKYEELDLD